MIPLLHKDHTSYLTVVFWKALAEVYQQHEKEKKDKYNQRVIDIEKSSFNPLVFTQQVEGWHQNATESTKDWQKK